MLESFLIKKDNCKNDAGQQTKELKPGKERSFREKGEKRKQRKRRKGIGDMQSLQIFH
jgi:hypothetical protein